MDTNPSPPRTELEKYYHSHLPKKQKKMEEMES